MNVEAYNLDSLRELVRNLQEENQMLRRLLQNQDIPIKTKDYFNKAESEPEDYDPDQGERIVPFEINEKVANEFLARFWGRLDVYAKRSRNGGYYPQCWNFWKYGCPKKENPKYPCDKCENRAWKKIEPRDIIQHLKGIKEDGSDAIGIYPLRQDNTCKFLVFDFDNHEKGAENTDYETKIMNGKMK